MKFLRSTLFRRIGIALILLGSLDPMEGSVLISLGSIVFAIASWLQRKAWKWHAVLAAAAIGFGVSALWIVSSKGGFDPATEWWWLLTILPYPVAWLGLLGVMSYTTIVDLVKSKQA
jgi:hypothetical protein